MYNNHLNWYIHLSQLTNQNTSLVYKLANDRKYLSKQSVAVMDTGQTAGEPVTKSKIICWKVGGGQSSDHVTGTVCCDNKDLITNPEADVTTQPARRPMSPEHRTPRRAGIVGSRRINSACFPLAGAHTAGLCRHTRAKISGTGVGTADIKTGKVLFSRISFFWATREAVMTLCADRVGVNDGDVWTGSGFNPLFIPATAQQHDYQIYGNNTLV